MCFFDNLLVISGSVVGSTSVRFVTPSLLVWISTLAVVATVGKGFIQSSLIFCLHVSLVTLSPCVFVFVFVFVCHKGRHQA